MVNNILTGVQRPSFDDFSKKRTFQDFLPKTSGFSVQHDVEDSVKRALSGDITNFTSARKTSTDPKTGEKKVTTHVATIFDLPILGNLHEDKAAYEWIQVYFGIDISTQQGIDQMNYLLNWGLYTYNWVYHSSVPKNLQELRFNSATDIVRFIRFANTNHKSAHLHRQIILCMMGSGMIFQNQTLGQVGRYLKDFRSEYIQKNFNFILDERGKGVGTFKAYIDEYTEKEVVFKLSYRGKGHGSIHKKLLSRPEIKEEDVFNDALGFEFEVNSKEDIIFLLNHIFTQIILKNYNLNASENSGDYQKVIEQLKNFWGFDLRQTNLLTEEDIQGFISRYPHALHYVLKQILSSGELRSQSKLMTGTGFSNIKYQGIFHFPGGLKAASVELRIVLQGNKNNDGMEHQDIRDGERVLRVKSRLAHTFTPSYIDRIANIVLQNLGTSEYSNETNPDNIGEILGHYQSKIETVVLGKGVTVGGFYRMTGEGERLGLNGIQITKIQ